MFMPVFGCLNLNIPFTNGIGVQQYLPSENTLILKNQKKIQYNQLVLAPEMQPDFGAVKGLDEIIRDPGYSCYSSHWDYFDQLTNENKTKQVYQIYGKKAIFYIPEHPFQGEVFDYKFLAVID